MVTTCAEFQAFLYFSHLFDKAREKVPFSKINPFSSLWAPIVLWTSQDFGKSAAWIHPSLLPSSPSVFTVGWAINLEPIHINARRVLIIIHACRVCHLTERVWGPTYETGQRLLGIVIFSCRSVLVVCLPSLPQVTYLSAFQFCNVLIRPLQRRVGFLPSFCPLMGFH